jgi:hypothetical protein
MNDKKIITLLMLTIPLLTLTFSSIVQLALSEPQAQPAWNYESEGFSVKVYAPSQAYPGDVVPINVTVNATADLLDVYVILEIFGSKYENCSHWNTTSFNVLWNEGLGAGEGITKQCDLEVPSNADPGLIYSYIICKWMTLDLQDHSKYDSFSVTYLKNKNFEELQNEHAELQNKYNELNTKYNELESKHEGEIGSTRNLMYIFVATTIVAAVTVIVLLIRRPNKPWT